ncbi:MAG: alpha/beta fold hydrolase [Rhodobacteraceae bacterium]|nr:alpha/beta fold hydrolase [Paracoccaceae bacterium]
MSLRHYGHGPRPALALHCSLAHAGEWAGVGAELADQLTLTAIDLPGHGSAPDWVPGTGIVAEAEAMALAALPPGAVDVIGHSFGGVVALRLALNHPERVRRLVLIEPTLFAAARAAGSPAADQHVADHAPFDAALAAGQPEQAARLFTALWGTGAAWEDVPQRQRDYITQRIGLITAAMPGLMADSGGLLAPDRLEALRRPVLIVTGGGSPAIIPAIADALALRLPLAERATVPGAMHMLPVTHAPQVAAAVGGFLSRE